MSDTNLICPTVEQLSEAMSKATAYLPPEATSKLWVEALVGLDERVQPFLADTLKNVVLPALIRQMEDSGIDPDTNSSTPLILLMGGASVGMRLGVVAGLFCALHTDYAVRVRELMELQKMMKETDG